MRSFCADAPWQRRTSALPGPGGPCYSFRQGFGSDSNCSATVLRGNSATRRPVSSMPVTEMVRVCAGAWPSTPAAWPSAEDLDCACQQGHPVQLPQTCCRQVGRVSRRGPNCTGSACQGSWPLCRSGRRRSAFSSCNSANCARNEVSSLSRLPADPPVRQPSPGPNGRPWRGPAARWATWYIDLKMCPNHG